MHVISEYWRRRKRLGRWRGSINWGHELRSIRFYLPVVLEKCFVIRWLDVGGVLGVQYQIKETGTNSKFTFLSQLCLFHKQFKIDNVLYIQWANLWTDIWVQQELKCDGMSNAKKKWGGGAFDLLNLNSLVRGGNSSKIKKKSNRLFDSFETNPTQKSSTVLSNVSLSVGAPVRVYLHSLVRRLLYSHLTPSTLSSPSLPPVLSPPVHSHPDTPSLPTTSLHGWLCLVLRSMHVCCLPWKTPQIESLFSVPPRAAEARRRPWCNHHRRVSCHLETTTPAEEVIVEAGRAQCTNTLICDLDQCVLIYGKEEKTC